jgi:hypothetical protein
MTADGGADRNVLITISLTNIIHYSIKAAGAGQGGGRSALIENLAISFWLLAASQGDEINPETRPKRDFDRSVTVRSNEGSVFVFNKSEE